MPNGRRKLEKERDELLEAKTRPTGRLAARRRAEPKRRTTDLDRPPEEDVFTRDQARLSALMGARETGGMLPERMRSPLAPEPDRGLLVPPAGIPQELTQAPSLPPGLLSGAAAPPATLGAPSIGAPSPEALPPATTPPAGLPEAGGGAPLIAPGEALAGVSPEAVSPATPLGGAPGAPAAPSPREAALRAAAGTGAPAGAIPTEPGEREQAIREVAPAENERGSRERGLGAIEKALPASLGGGATEREEELRRAKPRGPMNQRMQTEQR